MGCAICKNPPFIFTHIPKTGGTSFLSRRSPVVRQLRPYCEDLVIMNGHRYLYTFRLGCSRISLNDYFKFTIVRNPYDRFISLWLTKAKDTPLDDFIEMIKKRKIGWYPLKTQSSWVSARNGKLLIDHFIKYEDYEDGINRTLNGLGLPSVTLPHLRKTERLIDFRSYYNKDQIKFVQNLYDLDFKNFNYPKEVM